MRTGRLSVCVVGAALLAAVLPVGRAGAESVAPSCAEGPAVVDGTILGTPCDDRIVAPPGVAAVDGGGGDDTIVPAAIVAADSCPPPGCFLEVGSQTFEGGPGDDVVFGERGNDRLFGGEGNDQLFGGIGDDLLEGGPGNDRLSGGFGGDSIEGESGDDYVRGDASADPLLAGGPGSDTISFSTGVTPGFFDNHGIDFSAVPGLPNHAGERGLYLNLASGASDNGVAPFGGGVDKFVAADFETVIGTAFSDYIEGTDQPETIYGGGGGDVILGKGGDDVLYGGADGDELDGGTGADSGNGGTGGDHCEDLTSESNCEPVANGVKPRDTSKIAVGMLAPESTSYTQLYLAGSGGSDKVTATYSAGSVTFALASGSASFDTSPNAASGCEPPSSTEVACPLTKPLDAIVLAGLDGDDTLAATGFPATVSVVVAGGEGGDALTGGDLSEDVLADGPDEEGPGKDTLSALGRDDALLNNGGKDDLAGGIGNDLFLSDSICDGDAIVGGAGRDNASWAKFDPPGPAGVAARIDPGDVGEPGDDGLPDCGGAPLGTLSEVEDLEGSPGDDVFYGGDNENQLLGWEGEDVYSAGAGKDRILANSGDLDPSIACGADVDTALIDHPQYGDVAAADCEEVREGNPNSFRIETLLPPPPAAEVLTPEAKSPTQPKPPVSQRPPATCLARSAAVQVRCAQRPGRIGIGGRGLVSRIQWRNWGAPRAVGFGHLTVSGGCCGQRLSSRARVRASRRVQCGSRRWYTRLRVAYGKGFRTTYVRQYPSPTPCD